MGDFDGLVALVTGGASGIGRATVDELAARGARVGLLDLAPGDAPSEEVLPVEADVTDGSTVERAVSAVVERFGGLDVVVSNAGIGAAGPVEANDDEEWHRVLDVNVVGMARVARAALPHLRRSSHPVIVNTASIVATAGLPDRVLYSASKGAVYAMTMAMAADLVGEGIRVNCVCPGTVDTPWVGRLLDAAEDPPARRAALEARQPLGRLGTAEEVAFAIAFLASPRSGWTTGAAVHPDGGMQGLRVPPRPT